MLAGECNAVGLACVAWPSVCLRMSCCPCRAHTETVTPSASRASAAGQTGTPLRLLGAAGAPAAAPLLLLLLWRTAERPPSPVTTRTPDTSSYAKARTVPCCRCVIVQGVSAEGLAENATRTRRTGRSLAAGACALFPYAFFCIARQSWCGVSPRCKHIYSRVHAIRRRGSICSLCIGCNSTQSVVRAAAYFE